MFPQYKIHCKTFSCASPMHGFIHLDYFEIIGITALQLPLHRISTYTTNLYSTLSSHKPVLNIVIPQKISTNPLKYLQRHIHYYKFKNQKIKYMNTLISEYSNDKKIRHEEFCWLRSRRATGHKQDKQRSELLNQSKFTQTDN